MNRFILLLLTASIGLSAGLIPAKADQADRQARRAAIVAGAIREDVAQDMAQYKYAQCKTASGYDSACELQLYQDQQRASNAARRAAIIVGADRK